MLGCLTDHLECYDMEAVQLNPMSEERIEWFKACQSKFVTFEDFQKSKLVPIDELEDGYYQISGKVFHQENGVTTTIDGETRRLIRNRTSTPNKATEQQIQHFKLSEKLGECFEEGIYRHTYKGEDWYVSCNKYGEFNDLSLIHI